MSMTHDEFYGTVARLAGMDDYGPLADTVDAVRELRRDRDELRRQLECMTLDVDGTPLRVGDSVRIMVRGPDARATVSRLRDGDDRRIMLDYPDGNFGDFESWAVRLVRDGG